MAQSPSEAHKFVEELAWCINQLELGLERQNPDSRQAAETVKVLKILRSTKAPMVKKRQAMRNALGDYRKKMKDAEKKSLSSMRHSHFVSSARQRVNTGSRFLRHSHKQQGSREILNSNMSNLHIGEEPQAFPSTSSCAPLGGLSERGSGSGINERAGENFPSSSGDCGQQTVGASTSTVGDMFHFVPSNNSFCFGFESSTVPTTSGGTSPETCDQNSGNIADQGTTNEETVKKNFFKLEKSDNAFSFNFGGS